MLKKAYQVGVVTALKEAGFLGKVGFIGGRDPLTGLLPGQNPNETKPWGSMAKEKGIVGVIGKGLQSLTTPKVMA